MPSLPPKAVVGIVAAAAVVVVGVGVVVGVTGSRDDAAPTATRTSASASAAPSSTPSASPTARAVATTDAHDTARTTAALFCRPDVDQGTWLSSLRFLVSSDLYESYSSTIPGNVPCAGVTGSGSAVGDQQTKTDTAWQFTASTGGPVTITLHRDEPTDAWEVVFIQPGGNR